MERVDEEADVVVVGGGPGGSTLATLVAMRGHRVVCWKKRNSRAIRSASRCCHPRSTGSAASPASQTNSPRPDSRKKRGGTLRWGANPEPWTFAFSVSPKMTGETSYAYQVERSKFDQILLDHARHMGVDVREKHAVTDVIERRRPGPRRVLYRRRGQRGRQSARGTWWTPRATRAASTSRPGDQAVLGVLPQPRALRLLRGRQAPARAELRQHPVRAPSTAAGSGIFR